MGTGVASPSFSEGELVLEGSKARLDVISQGRGCGSWCMILMDGTDLAVKVNDVWVEKKVRKGGVTIRVASREEFPIEDWFSSSLLCSISV